MRNSTDLERNATEDLEIVIEGAILVEEQLATDESPVYTVAKNSLRSPLERVKSMDRYSKANPDLDHINIKESGLSLFTNRMARSASIVLTQESANNVGTIRRTQTEPTMKLGK